MNKHQFAICINNRGYEVSLGRRIFLKIQWQALYLFAQWGGSCIHKQASIQPTVWLVFTGSFLATFADFLTVLSQTNYFLAFALAQA